LQGFERKWVGFLVFAWAAASGKGFESALTQMVEHGLGQNASG
jgi:NADH:ubiquinone oxidoreductase subunit 4 (subunit M)